MVLHRDWLEAPKAEQVKGRALTCMVCKGTLLLNGESLKLHIKSKRHAKQLKLFSTYLDPICFAENPDDDSSGTYQLPYIMIEHTALDAYS